MRAISTVTNRHLSVAMFLAIAGLGGCADLTAEQVLDVLTRRPPAGNQGTATPPPTAPPPTTASTPAPAPVPPPTPTATPAPPPTPTAPPAMADAGIEELLGTWVNPDSNTRGMTKLVITKVNDQTVGLQGYGQCSPADCDWGKIQAVVTQPSTVGTYQFSFKQTRISVRRSGAQLQLETADHYTDRSGRQDRTDRYVFNKVQLRTPILMFPRQ